MCVFCFFLRWRLVWRGRMVSCWFEVLLSFRSTGTNLRRQQTPSLRTDGSKPVLLSHLLYAYLLSYCIYNIGERVYTLCIGETVCSVVGKQRYHFFRTDPIRPIPIQSDTSSVFLFSFFNQCIISILLCVDLIVTLLCVKHNLLECFSTGGSKLLGMQPKSGSRDRSEWLADCIQPKKQHHQQKHNSKCFSDARLLF